MDGNAALLGCISTRLVQVQEVREARVVVLKSFVVALQGAADCALAAK